jgi:S-formylglutathione hydrolase FrmB
MPKWPCAISGRDANQQGKRLCGSAGASHYRNLENPFSRATFNFIAGVSLVILPQAPQVLNAGEPAAQSPDGPSFEVAYPTSHPDAAQSKVSGRLMVVLGHSGSRDPRLTVGQTGKSHPPVLGRDVADFAPGGTAVLDGKSAICPITNLSELKPGRYAVQALLHINPDLNYPNAPGDLYSPVASVELDATATARVRLELTEAVPAETLPANSEFIKYLKIKSRLLSEFHGRPIYLRAGVILPRDFSRQPDRRYPLEVHIGGYAARFSDVGDLMNPDTSFHRVWQNPDNPQMLFVHLDGAGPLGDPYQVDSANHGPYGAAVTRELIPYVEEHYRGIGQGRARFLDGGSTGGWVSLALQVFYPGVFNGAWSFCPDSVDFRSFQLVDIYHDDNAYINQHGFERPGARDTSGDVRYTMRHECQVENVLGRGDSWIFSGGQWGAWNATYGARGADGRPVPLWNPATGVIDHKASEHWKSYDLRRVLEANWKSLGPKLRGKLHIWVGEADDFFLNNAVHKLDNFLSRAEPPFEGSITYGRGQGHCWIGLSRTDMLKQMAARLAAAGFSQPPPGR